jgi:DNA-binding MarR family transcriptional regulator
MKKIKSKDSIIHPRSLDDLINHLIYRTARLLRLKFQRDMKAVGLDMTQEQYFILFKLWQKDGLYQAELADGLLGDAPNITRILDVMEKKKMISRRPDAEDRRRFRIFVAEKGHEIRKLYKIHASASRLHDYRNLDDGDLEQLRQILKTIEENISGQL